MTTRAQTTHRIALVLSILLAFGMFGTAAAVAEEGGGERVFELRTYITLDGRLDALNKRFREHTIGLFEKHGMTVMGFWEPTDAEKGKGNTLIYMLAFPSEEARSASWKAFAEDPEWKKVAAESQKDGKIIERIESVLMAPTDYSSVR
ncbi:MAG: NIPSNAP family protein [Acidobacteriota bacterium]